MADPQDFLRDLILYYEILDNDLISFDLGVSGKQIEGDFLVVDTETQQRSSESFDVIIPMAYSRVEVGLPLTGLGAYVEGSFLSFDDNTMTEYQAAIVYNFMECSSHAHVVSGTKRSTDRRDADFHWPGLN